MSWKSTKDISGDKGIIKTITQEGEDWQKPSDQDEVLGEPPAPYDLKEVLNY